MTNGDPYPWLPAEGELRRRAMADETRTKPDPAAVAAAVQRRTTYQPRWRPGRA